MKLYAKNFHNIIAQCMKKHCGFQSSIAQQYSTASLALCISSRILCHKNLNFLSKYSQHLSFNIVKRNVTSQNSDGHEEYSDCKNTDIQFKSSPSSKTSLAIKNDELLFFDKFMQYGKETEPSHRVDNPIPLRKHYFSPTSTLTGRTHDEIKEYLKLHSIMLNKTDIPPPIIEFSDVEFPAAIMKLLTEKYSAPTAIQAMGWSLALSGLDVIGIGETGSGKTLAYILPGLLHTAHQQQVLTQVDSNFNCHSPIAVILAPSRELATQVARVANQYSQLLGVQVLLTTGGVKKQKHLNIIWNTKPKFVVATPGRLLDLLRDNQLVLSHCSYLVLDEADRMLDMGFEAQIRSIMEQARSDRQTLLWSATWPAGVERLANSITPEGTVRLSVGSTELRANPNVEQRVYMCEFLEKTQLLKKLLSEMLERDPNGKALVFVQSKRDISKLYHKLRRSGFSCESLHAGLDQPLRDRVVADFRKGRFSTLIATDLAARGLDIQGLNCVINYDFPANVETYIHRIGRTGRCGQRGVAHTFFSQRNISRAPSFVQLLRESGYNIDNKLLYLTAKSRYLPSSKKELFLPFVPQKTSDGHKRSESIMGGRSGKLLGPVDPEALTPREYAMQQSHQLQQAKLQAKLDKRDKSKIVNTKYVIQKKK